MSWARIGAAFGRQTGLPWIFAGVETMNLRAWAIVLLIFGSGFAAGCERNNETIVTFGTLYGKVTLAGQPVPGGRLIFLSKEGMQHTARIEADGSYRQTIPVGEMQVGVDTESVKAGLRQSKTIGKTNAFAKAMMAKSKDRKSFDPKDLPQEKDLPSNFAGMKYVPIPEKYRNPKQSGLSVTVQQGEHEQSFDLP
jgi:hypothetical protein